MRKQTKLVAVVSASALLALGASLASFAASKGPWMMVDGEWYCYDKNGDAYENTFCTSNGKDYYVGDDGQLVRSAWVEDDGNYYFVNSAGQKITNDWRLTAPYDDDSAEEQWYYFKSNGKRAEDEKITYKGKTYFFDSEGEMLTGWVQKSGDGWDEASTADVKGTETYYCDETGVRLENSWVYDYAPDVDQDDINSDDDEHWYYLKSSGKAATGKKSNVKGQTYFFDEEGKMLTGWVVKTGSNGYTQAWNDDDDTDGHFETTLSELNASEIHFCGDEDDGHMKKDKWVKAYSNTQYGEDDDDNDKYWFWINKSGDVYVPDDSKETGIGATRYKLDDCEGDTFDDQFKEDNYDDDDNTIGLTMYEKKINSKTYYFNANGQMLSKFVKTDASDEEDGVAKMYYLGGWDDGYRKDGSQTIKDEAGTAARFYFATSDNKDEGYFNAAGINGAKSGKLYSDGLLVTADDDKYEIKDVTIYTVAEGQTTATAQVASYIVNKSGSIQTAAKEYKDDDDVVVDATGFSFSGTKGALYKSFNTSTVATGSNATK